MFTPGRIREFLKDVDYDIGEKSGCGIYRNFPAGFWWMWKRGARGEIPRHKDRLFGVASAFVFPMIFLGVTDRRVTRELAPLAIGLD